MNEMQRNGSIALVLGCDQAYFDGLWVTLVSMLIHTNSDQTLDIYIFDGGIAILSKQKMEAEIRRLNKNVNIEWLFLDIEQFQALPPMENASLMAYARLLIPILVPVPKVIWLDVDLFVKADIRDLWQIELSADYLMAACLEYPGGISNDISNLSELDISGDTPYFNSGVLLMDNQGLREVGFTRSCIDYLTKHVGNYKWHDQSAINVVLVGKILQLPRKWNYLNSLIETPEDECNQLQQDSYIFHYLQRPKPWKKYVGSLHAAMFYKLSSVSGLKLHYFDSAANAYEYFKWKFPIIALKINYFKKILLKSSEDKSGLVEESQRFRLEYKKIRNKRKLEISNAMRKVLDVYRERTGK
jgi:lipopolysaccharide biosynthesis glycosyltransferase